MRLRVAFVVCLFAVAAAAVYFAYGSRPSGGEAQQKPVVFVIATPTPASRKTAPPVQPRASAAPVSSSTPAPTPAPSASAATPSPTPAPVKAAASSAPEKPKVPPVVFASPDAPPQILALSLSSPVVHAGEVVSGTVETSSNVASVVASIGGYAMQLRKTGVGRFAMSYQVPLLPPFLRKTYIIQVVARNTKGASVSSGVPITVR